MTHSPGINLNADMGEAFGSYSFGHDAELMPLVPTVNVACGGHAGDPRVMRETVAMAADHGVEIGAHVGLPDREGFGRRAMDLEALDVHDLTLFQAGALLAFATAAGVTLTHVKPHGILYRACAEREDYAYALVGAVAELGIDLSVIVGEGAAGAAGEQRGLRVTHEGYVDLDYRADGLPIIEPKKRPDDPEEVGRRAVALATTGRTTAAGGEELAIRAPTLALHGDSPTAVQTARAVRAALEEADVRILGLRDAIEARAGWTAPPACT